MRTAITIIFLMLSTVSTAHADCGKCGKGCGEHFQMADKNKDGNLSAAEHEAHAREMFTKADTNKDGALSKEEADAMHKDMAKHCPASDKARNKAEGAKDKHEHATTE